MDYGRITPLLAKAIQDLNLKLEDLATTTATSTDQSSFTSRFFTSLFAHLTQWFADATNGITDFFARRGRFEEELCLGETCVTPEQFAEVFGSSQSAAAGAQTVVGGLTGAPDGSSTPTAEVSADTATTTTPATDEEAADAGAVGGPSTASATSSAPAAVSGADNETNTSSDPLGPAGSNASAAADQITDDQPISVPAKNTPPPKELPATE